MTDRPILFSGQMIKALLAGRKTQTRRLCKDQPPAGITIIRKIIRPFGKEPYHAFERRTKFGNFGGEVPVKISRGDRLWVRETWAPLSALTHNDPGSQALADRGFYRADEGTVDGEISKWTPSIFMPRHASRLTLIVTDVRVERLQDISEADAIAEGIERSTKFPDRCMTPAGDYAVPVVAYQRVWEAINGPGSWDANPWVAAYTFRVIKQNIDQIEKVAA